jgi:hypothetical protein
MPVFRDQILLLQQRGWSHPQILSAVPLVQLANELPSDDWRREMLKPGMINIAEQVDGCFLLKAATAVNTTIKDAPRNESSRVLNIVVNKLFLFDLLYRHFFASNPFFTHFPNEYDENGELPPLPETSAYCLARKNFVKDWRNRSHAMLPKPLPAPSSTSLRVITSEQPAARDIANGIAQAQQHSRGFVEGLEGDQELHAGRCDHVHLAG